jgi:hypothetical protein
MRQDGKIHLVAVEQPRTDAADAPSPFLLTPYGYLIFSAGHFMALRSRQGQICRPQTALGGTGRRLT